MMLNAAPPFTAEMEHTADSKGLIVRDTSVCRFMMMDDAVTIGSMALCGIAACPPIPDISIVNRSPAAMSAPGREAIVWDGNVGQRCIPKATSTGGLFVKTPSSIILFAPAPPSSAG
mmetsp:Transcript_20060/g.29537  ORF Transcript_20060/g.29537 Transcript_20060/m.29537 type:complete len:117 (-) Transcript_20060:244-594(-)